VLAAEFDPNEVSVRESRAVDLCDGLALRFDESAVLQRAGYQVKTAVLDDKGELHTDEIGTSGVRYSAGLPTSEDKNYYFRPVLARGRGYDHGLYHSLFLSSTTYRRSWGNIAEGLATGLWSVKPATREGWDEAEVEQAKEQARFCGDALLRHLEGGWKQFLREWMYCLIAGCSIFERIYHPPGHEKAGAIRKLAFRYPSQVHEWILDEYDRDLVGVLFDHEGRRYFLPARALLIESWDRFGTNFEGISPLRSVARWIELLNLLLQLQGLAAEKYGVPWVAASRKSRPDTGIPVDGVDRHEQLQAILDDALAEDAPVIGLPDDTEVVILVGPGSMPDFEPIIRLCIERIAEILRAEGSLIGVGSTGAYAARESAVGDLVRFVPYFAGLVCETINGANNTAFTGVIKDMVDARFGGPIDGLYPELSFSVSSEADAARYQKINESIQAGSIHATAETENIQRAELGLQPLTDEEAARFYDTRQEEGHDTP